MAKSYDQPVLNANNIVISDARILLKDYSTNYQFTGSEQVNLDAPPTGFVDAGLISQATLNITKDDIKLEVGLPKTTVKTAERSREVTISFNFHELGAETVALITGANKYNVLAAGLITVPGASSNTLGDQRFADQFMGGDKAVIVGAATGVIVDATDIAIVATTLGNGVVTHTPITAPSVNDVFGRMGGIASDAVSNGVTVLTMDTADAAGMFTVGDLVTYATAGATATATLKALRDSTARYLVTAVGSTTITLNAEIPASVTGTDILCAYNSVELVDQLGSQIRRTLLMFFDYQDDTGNAYQYCLYFPKVKATGAFSPDFKGGENYADVPAGFSSEAVSLMMADGSTQRVMMLPYVFAA